MTRRLLVTGGQGFVGQAVVAAGRLAGYDVRLSSRQAPGAPRPGLQCCQVGELSRSTDWFAALQGVDVVVHCAGRAHVLKDRVQDPLQVFREVNVQGTENLARQAVRAGVKRLVFVSSIGVNGLQTSPGKPFSESDLPKPHNAYAMSKWEAEQALSKLGEETGLEVVMVRPPLVYGRKAPGNFGSLMRAVQQGWPLPLGAVDNQRSLIALDNLADFIVTCVDHPLAAGQTLVVSDGHDLSTTDLVRGMARAAGRPSRLLPVPVWALQLAAKVLGKSSAVQQLCGNLQLDISKAQTLLGWAPPVSVDEGLKRAMAA